MNRRIVGLLVFALATVAAPGARSSGPPLPEWDDVTRKPLMEKDWVPGAGLLTDDLPSAETPTAVLDGEKPTAEEEAKAVGAPATEIPEEFINAYFDTRPESFLIDPQKLLDSRAARDRTEFLKHHAAESGIDLFIYVFGKDQEIPGEVREEEVIERFFAAGRPAMIVFYFLSQPQQSIIYLSPSLTDRVPAVEQRRMLSSSVDRALSEVDSLRQLEAFAVQMGIRIYWMERMLGGSGPEAVTRSDDGPLLVRRPAAKPPSSLRARIDAALEGGRLYLLPGGIALGACLLLGGGYVWWRRRISCRLPEIDVEPRLGGAHAAGVGGVISFAHPGLSPASQRQQVPDYQSRRR